MKLYIYTNQLVRYLTNQLPLDVKVITTLMPPPIASYIALRTQNVKKVKSVS